MIRMDDNDDDDSIHDHLSFDDDVVMAVVLNYRTFIGVIYIEKLAGYIDGVNYSDPFIGLSDPDLIMITFTDLVRIMKSEERSF